ncbi:MAG: hypothetical protein JW891_18850 [Candidatus Lokiarchaeota archaeon]|nr:hypothetical protein [Candidatus Lokiarchaeota archaeon]
MNIENTRPQSSIIDGSVNPSQNDSYIENISNALVSFLSLSKQVQRPDIRPSKMCWERSSSLNPKIDISIEEDNQSELSKEDENKIEIRFKSLREYIEETAPYKWNLALKQESLKAWIEDLKKDLGIALSFNIEVIYDQEKASTYLKINDSKIRLYEFRDWVSLLNDYRKDLNWEEIDNNKLVKVKGVDDIKYIEALLINAVNGNQNSQLYEFLWLAYKTSEEFTLFRNKENNKIRAFLKQGDFYSSLLI